MSGDAASLVLMLASWRSLATFRPFYSVLTLSVGVGGLPAITAPQATTCCTEPRLLHTCASEKQRLGVR